MLLYRLRYWVLAIYGVLTLAGAYFATQLNVLYDFESLFPKNDPDYQFYIEFRDRFEPDDNVLFVAFHRPEGIFDSTFLNKTAKISRGFDTLPHVARVVDLQRFRNPIATPLGFTTIRAIHTDNPGRYVQDSIKIMQDVRLNGKLVSADATVLNVVIFTEELLEQHEAEEINDALFDYLHEQAGDLKWHVAGRANLQAVFVRNQIEEMAKYIILSSLIVIITLFTIFRSVRLTLVALISILVGLVLFLGFLGFFRVPLDFMSTLFPIIMLIVGMSDMVHILSRYTDGINNREGRIEVIQNVIKEIGMALLLTSVTTSIGFLSLLTSQIEPIRNFGVMAAIGVFIAFIVTITFSTTCLLFVNESKFKNRWKAMRLLESFSVRLDKVMNRNHKRIVLYSVGIIVFCVIGISRVSTDARLEFDLPANQRITEDFYFFEEKLGGFRPLEVALIPLDDYKIDDFEIVQLVDKVESYFRDHPDYSGIVSPNDIFKALYRAHNADRIQYYKIPEDSLVFERYKRLSHQFDKQLGIVLTPERDMGRLSGKLRDVGTHRNDELISAFGEWFDETIPPGMLDYRFTGNGLLIDNSNKYLVSSLLSGLGLAFLVVSLLMALLFRNVKMVIISLIPNVFPLILTAAVMGYLNIALNAPTSIIFAIAFGIAVDDTIHFLSRYRLNIADGLSKKHAVKKMVRITGKAVGLTTVILFMGFMVLATSVYDTTARVGILISITLLVAYIADLILIPFLLRVFFRKEHKD